MILPHKHCCIIIDEVSILLYLSSFYIFWAICDALVLREGKQPSLWFPPCSIATQHIINLLPVLTVSPINIQGCQKCHNNGEQLWWCDKKLGSWSLPSMHS